MKKFLKNHEVQFLASELAKRIMSHALGNKPMPNKGYKIAPVLKIYGVPRGGIPVTYLLQAHDPNHFKIVDNVIDADYIVDDIIDSGATAMSYANHDKAFFALIDKLKYPEDTNWYVFPWEAKDEATEEGVEANVTRILQYIGEDVTRGGLLETPARFGKALGEWFSGYKYTDEMIAKELKTFEDGAEGCDQMVIRRNIPLYSHCEHHIAAIFGVCTIAYIPKNKVLGLSKMDRLVNIFARRLQVQERLTNQIADAMYKHLDPVGVGVWINARHMCVESRGVKHSHSETISLALRGAMRDQPDTRAEFLAACKG